MNRELLAVLQKLVLDRKIASLGTLHENEPFVSMVPFALTKDGSLILHVSRLASHTQDMLDHPEVSLLIAESETSEKMAQELARVTVQGQAQMLDRDSENHIQARKVYLARFPDAASLFEFSDFNIFIVRPVSVRLIAGFGRAMTLTGDDFATAMSAAMQKQKNVNVASAIQRESSEPGKK